MLLSQWAVWVQLSDCCNGKDVPRLHCSYSDDRDPCLPVCPSLYTYTFCTDMSLLREVIHATGSHKHSCIFTETFSEALFLFRAAAPAVWSGAQVNLFHLACVCFYPASTRWSLQDANWNIQGHREWAPVCLFQTGIPVQCVTAKEAV